MTQDTNFVQYVVEPQAAEQCSCQGLPPPPAVGLTGAVWTDSAPCRPLQPPHSPSPNLEAWDALTLLHAKQRHQRILLESGLK